MRQFLWCLGIFVFISKGASSSLLFHEGEKDIPPTLSSYHFKQGDIVGTYLFPEKGSFGSILKTSEGTKKQTLEMFHNSYRIHSVAGRKRWHQKFEKYQLRMDFFERTEEGQEGLKPTYCVFVYQDEQNRCIAHFAASLSRIKKKDESLKLEKPEEEKGEGI